MEGDTEKPRAANLTEERARSLPRPDGAKIAYRVLRGAGRRPVLVLIHGMASNLTRWWEFVARTGLTESWDLLRLDLRGHGGTAARGRVGMEVWCDDLAAVLEAEGYATAAVGGHCLGANIALFFAARYPERTAGLVLIEPMPPAAAVGALKRAQAFRPVIAGLARIFRGINRLGIYRRRLPPLDLAVLDQKTRAAMATEGTENPMMKRYGSPWQDLRHLPAAVYLQEFLELGRALPSPAGIRLPVLSLLSAGGFLTDLEMTREWLAAIPRGETVVLPARHWIPTECPDEMRREIERWCRALPPSRPQ